MLIGKNRKKMVQIGGVLYVIDRTMWLPLFTLRAYNDVYRSICLHGNWRWSQKKMLSHVMLSRLYCNRIDELLENLVITKTMSTYAGSYTTGLKTQT